MSKEQYALEDLLRVMQRLRDPQTGCPWDIRQDFETIVPSTLEECYELAHAIEQGDYPHVEEELGDVLFQVVFYAQMGNERGLFSFDSVVNLLVEKLVRRHPHVFADGEIEGVVGERTTVEAVQESWEAIKQSERDSKLQTGVLADVPRALPALPRAQKLQRRAAQVNFDWPEAAAVLDKLEEEIAELREVIAQQSDDGIQDEMGDVLFTCVNLARHLGVDAEACLRQSSGKFEQRFGLMEELASVAGGALSGMNAEQLNNLWERAKQADLRQR